MLSDGHSQALEELQILDAAGYSIEVVSVGEPDERGILVVEVSIDAPLETEVAGIEFRPRERFLVDIPSTFPWDYPRVTVPHRRWERRPHVNFGSNICLYLASDVEWNPSDGMYGLLSRLVEWVKRAAVDDLDPEAAPLHPPYAPVDWKAPTVIPRDDAPNPTDAPWLGFASIGAQTDSKIELREWLPYDMGQLLSTPRAAVAVLSHRDLPYQYPTQLGALIQELEPHGISKVELLVSLHITAHHNGAGQPLFVVIGTPMRGIKGVDQRQHLAVWHIGSEDADRLRMEIPQHAGPEELELLRNQQVNEIFRWAESAEVSWCHVDEARPEATRDRGEGSPMAEFAGQRAAIVGCGAIGSHLAEHLVRAGVTELTLVDNDIVTVGNLSRQAYDESDLALPKADSLANRLKRISPELYASPHFKNAISLLGDPTSPLWQCDVLFDATANRAVAKRIESMLQSIDKPPWIMSMQLGHRGDRSLLTATPPNAVGGPIHLTRNAKLAATATSRLETFADEFWPDPPRTDLFLPEPGCSSPTFTGANSDVAAVVGALARDAGTALKSGNLKTGSWVLTELSEAASGAPARSERRDVANPVSLQDAVSGYAVHIEPHVMVEINAWINHNIRNTPANETGGLLFGEIDDATRIVSVTAAIGPPPDSLASPTGFICGTAGVAAAAKALAKLSRGTHRPVGMWHTHPDGNPSASSIDYKGMQKLTGQSDRPLPRQLLLIAGGQPLGSKWNCYLFDHRKTRKWPAANPAAVHVNSNGVGNIGLALSGGGLRAAAFHLGCFRALHDRGLLPEISTISGVSGGSIVAALWAYTDMSFDEFDRELGALLHRGLASTIARHWAAPGRLAKAIQTTATAGLISAPNAIMGKGGPLTRSTSSFHALELAIRDLIGDTMIQDVARGNLDVVFNACDLRTGSAFRFGSKESGSWRDGTIRGNRVSVATAVATSAAYPLAFPANDFTQAFIRRNGTQHQRRVILTDGGVYDNLGTTVLLPSREPEISTNVLGPHQWIISCDAGRGLDDGSSRPYWFLDRLKRSFEATYRKAQNADRSQLFGLDKQPTPVNGMVVAMLGMSDKNFPVPIADLVPRDKVIGIKTSFTALTDEQIRLLTTRGEQTMGNLIARYGPRL